ncbi:MAG TPA: aldehyde dehydrogenase family protein, partial [Opitutaceae bacterium]
MEFTARNPATKEVLAPVYQDAGDAAIDAAAWAAHASAGEFAGATPQKRAAFLDAVADELVALGSRLIERAQQETGLPQARLEGERVRTVGQLRLFATVAREGSWVDARIDTALSDRSSLSRPDLRRMLRPLRPVTVFGASNFPRAFSVARGDTA